MKNLINAKSKTDLSGFYVAYHGSTLLEKPGIYGISHLMEHLMCKNFEDLQDKFDEDGISWNAYTDTHIIVFHLTGLDKYINKWKYIFLEKLHNFNVTQETLDKEKMIVIEEYKDSFNKPSDAHLLNLYRKLYGDYGAIGQRESIEAITLKDCKEFFDVQFKTPQIVNVSKHNKFISPRFKEYSINLFKNKLSLKKKNIEVNYEKINDSDLKAFAVKTLPVIEHHLQLAKEVFEKVNVE